MSPEKSWAEKKQDPARLERIARMKQRLEEKLAEKAEPK